MNKSSYLFSVIIPIYNTEDFLRECIESIVVQTVGFEKNIQLILVNDGSSDGSERICLEYRDRYPQNIIYLYKENGGVASAMKKGLEVAEGEYVNFFGSDDIWSKDAFKHVKAFIKKNSVEQLELITCQIKLFGRQNGAHPLNYKYGKDQVVNLYDKPNYIQLTAGNCFFKKQRLDKIGIEEGMQYEEDALLINEVLLETCKYGVVSKGIYFYRKRTDSSSLASQSITSKIRYTEAPYRFAKKLFDLSKKKYGTVLGFIQYTVMYEMQWRFTEKLPDTMTDEDVKAYTSIMYALLQDIEPKCIYDQKNMSLTKKAYAFKMKYGDDFFQGVQWEKGKAFFEDTRVYNMRTRARCKVYNLRISDETIIIDGTTDISVLGIGLKLCLEDSKRTFHTASLHPFPKNDAYSFTGEKFFEGTRFHIELPIEGKRWIRFVVVFPNGDCIRLKPWFGIFAKLNHRYEHSYWREGKYLLKFENNRIKILKYRRKVHFASEMRFLKDLIRVHHWKQVCFRLLYHIKKCFNKKPIWIISDRNFKAGDNGENFFKYAVSQNKENSRAIYFLFDKTKPDYQRLRQYGKVLDPYSLDYKMKFLMADKIISSHADPTVMNPFKGEGYNFMDLFNFDYVYLQHGVLPGDLSSWLNKLNKNMRLFITSTEREYQSVLEGNYAYTEREVKLAGMTRHDALGVMPIEKTIVFLPTWREKLAGNILPDERDRTYVEDFQDTYYCKFYNQLINDKRLLNALKKSNYKGEFYVHPSFRKQAIDFVGNDMIKVGADLADYEEILNKAALMITDYSSVAFDFGYQRKPIVYSQFDSDTWNEDHFYEKGYFDYEKDGFGPVAYDLEETVAYIVAYLERDCQIEDKYRERADRFFKYSDHNNCQRVYNEIIALDAN